MLNGEYKQMLQKNLPSPGSHFISKKDSNKRVSLVVCSQWPERLEVAFGKILR